MSNTLTRPVGEPCAPPRSRKTWTLEEKEMATSLAAFGLSNEEIGIRLGRSAAAVQVHFSNEIRLRPGRLDVRRYLR